MESIVQSNLASEYLNNHEEKTTEVNKDKKTTITIKKSRKRQSNFDKDDSGEPDRKKMKKKMKYPPSVKDIKIKSDEELQMMSREDRIDYLERKQVEIAKVYGKWKRFYKTLQKKKTKHDKKLAMVKKEKQQSCKD